MRNPKAKAKLFDKLPEIAHPGIRPTSRWKYSNSLGSTSASLWKYGHFPKMINGRSPLPTESRMWITIIRDQLPALEHLSLSFLCWPADAIKEMTRPGYTPADVSSNHRSPFTTLFKFLGKYKRRLVERTGGTG